MNKINYKIIIYFSRFGAQVEHECSDRSQDQSEPEDGRREQQVRHARHVGSQGQGRPEVTVIFFFL